MTDIAKRITHHRKRLYMSCDDLCEKAGITLETLHNVYGSRHKPTVRTLKGLADALGVSIDYLLNGGPEDELPESFKENIAENVRSMRKRIGWTRQELSEKSGVSVRTLVIVENAQRDVRMETLWEIARALKTSPKALMKKGKSK